MHQRLILRIEIMRVCLAVALLLAVSGAAQTAPPPGACVCSPAIFLFDPTHR
jgi:hypothetical protein